MSDLDAEVRAYALRTGTPVEEAKSLIVGAGLAALEGGDSLVRHIRIGMIVALNLIEANHAKAVQRAWEVVADCDVQLAADAAPMERSPAARESIAPVVELRAGIR